MNKDLVQNFMNRIKDHSEIVIIQADNPDADSIGSAIALEGILANLGKKTHLYCAVSTPTYLHYMSDWSRVSNQLADSFDLSIIVDASTTTLLEKIQLDRNYKRYLATDKIVLDHHATVSDTVDAQLTINEPDLSSTCELVFQIAKAAQWEIPIHSAECIVAGILGDTQGLSNNLASSQTYRTVADLIDKGVSREQLEEKRREYNKYHESIFRYKGALIEKTELYDNNSIAIVLINQAEINNYSPLYNPSALVQQDMLQIENVKIAVVMKIYDDHKITAAIRTNSGYPIAGELASFFGGGGHDYASGFKITKYSTPNELKQQVIAQTISLLN